jgi:SNW domain-containing protein 1
MAQDGGMDSGLAADDQYNLYSKPLFADRGSNLHRPNRAQDDELHGGEGAEDKDVRSERFKPTKVRSDAIDAGPFSGCFRGRIAA